MEDMSRLIAQQHHFEESEDPDEESGFIEESNESSGLAETLRPGF
jgi:hypothetical protein